MIQEQLTDYISSQIKLGVSREAVKTVLVDAGWASGDVEDTLKKVEGNAPEQMATAKPMTASPAKTEPQVIRVSDLVSGSGTMAPITATNTTPTTTSPAAMSSTMNATLNAVAAAKVADTKVDPAKFGGKITGNTFQATNPKVMPTSYSASSTTSGKGKGGMVMGIIAVIIILGLGGAAGYFYSQNAALAAKVATLNAQTSSVNAQLASLNNQVGDSNTGVQAQISSLTAANADLALNLSFFAVPLGTTPTATPLTISGSLSGASKNLYQITTPRGATVYILNSANAKISAELKPLVGQTVSLTGTYIPGSDQMTVETVGNIPNAAATTTSMMMSSTTASSTPSSTSAN
jgi:hypothetical protein